MKFALSPSNHKSDVSSALFKNFRESYVSHCSVIKVPVSQTTRLLYHIFHFLSTTFLSFLNCLNCIFKMYSCDSSVRIPQFPVAVNRFFKFFLHLYCSPFLLFCCFQRWCIKGCLVSSKDCVYFSGISSKYSFTACSEGSIRSASFSISSVGFARSGTMMAFIPALQAALIPL